MDQIRKYIIALTNLYGIVPIDKVAEIYNMQNEDQISFSFQCLTPTYQLIYPDSGIVSVGYLVRSFQ